MNLPGALRATGFFVAPSHNPKDQPMVAMPRRSSRRLAADRMLAQLDSVAALDEAIRSSKQAVERARELRRQAGQADAVERAARRWEVACLRKVIAEAKAARARAARAKASLPRRNEVTGARLNTAAARRRTKSRMAQPKKGRLA